MRLAGWISAAFSLCLVGFLFVGEYTKTVHLSGQILPDIGAINVVAPQFGRVTARQAFDGGAVKKGDVLFEISSERHGDGHNSDVEVDRLIESRRSLARQETELQVVRHGLRKAGFSQRILMVEEELQKLGQELDAQQNRIASAKKMRNRFRILQAQGFSSAVQVTQMENDYNEQISRKRGLERNAIALRREAQQLRDDSEEADSQIRILTAQNGMNLVSLEQEANEHQVRGRVQIVAPTSGTIGALAGELGESVDAGRVLATVIPTGSVLIAQLMAPSRAIGTLEVGQKVLVRLDAFPYQKFGSVSGVITRVDRSPITTAGADRQTQEAMYRVIVRLQRDSLLAYGKPQRFKVGMSLEADIKQDRRALIEWIFDPLLSAAKDHGVM